MCVGPPPPSPFSNLPVCALCRPLPFPAGPDTPPPLSVWSEMTSDEAISRFVASGIAAHTLVRKGGVLQSDFSWLAGLEVRPGYEGYGALAKFDRTNMTLLSITVKGEELTPASPDWAHAKWLYKSSALVGITLRDHLVGIHLLAGLSLPLLLLLSSSSLSCLVPCAVPPSSSRLHCLTLLMPLPFCIPHSRSACTLPLAPRSQRVDGCCC